MKKNIPIVFLITTFLLQIHIFRSAYSATLLDRVVAVVNNEVITWSELRDLIDLEGKSYLERSPKARKKR